jgi:general nucleoside transport system permease protein
VQTSQIGFIGIAVALLGRNKAIGVALSALLFASLLYGTSTRSISQTVLKPELAGNLTLMIQALVLLFVGADVLIMYLWQARRRLRPRRLAGTKPAAPAEAG